MLYGLMYLTYGSATEHEYLRDGLWVVIGRNRKQFQTGDYSLYRTVWDSLRWHWDKSMGL